jgi:transposase-like protein
MNLIERAKRRRYSAEEKTGLVARYLRSGKTQVAFCAEAGITVPTLAAWRRALPQSAPRDGDLVEVMLPALAEVRLEVNGCTLRVGVGTSPAWLGAVVQHLRAC